MTVHIYFKSGNVLTVRNLSEIKKTSTSISWTHEDSSEKVMTMTYDQIEAIHIERSFFERLRNRLGLGKA